MRWSFCLIGVWCFLNYADLQSQAVSGTPLKSKSILLSDCQIKIDNFTVIPKTVVITVGSDTLSSYTIYNNTLAFGHDICHQYKDQFITIQYRTFSFDVEKPYFLIDSSKLTFKEKALISGYEYIPCLLYTSPSPRDRTRYRMPSSA